MKDDVVGAALLDYYNENYSSDIIVKSSIAEDDTISIPYLFRSDEDFPILEKKAINLCSGKVLDVGAGSGCHSFVLSKNQMDVTAIDTSKGAVEVMRKQGINAHHLNFHDVTGKYDTLLFMMNGVGIAGTLDGLTPFLNQAKTLLNDRGQIILDSSDISYMFKEEDGSVWVDLNNSYYGEVTYQMQYKKMMGDKFDWLFVDFSTLNAVASSLGFNVELIFEDDNNQYLAKLSL